MSFFLILELEIGLLPLSRPIRGLRSTLSEKKKNNNDDKWSMIGSFVNKQVLFSVPWDVKAVWRVAWCWWHKQNRLRGRSWGWGWIVSFEHCLLFWFGILGVLISFKNGRYYRVYEICLQHCFGQLCNQNHILLWQIYAGRFKFVKVRGDSLAIM